MTTCEKTRFLNCGWASVKGATCKFSPAFAEWLLSFYADSSAGWPCRAIKIADGNVKFFSLSPESCYCDFRK